jgi:hypothetical protein
MCALAGFLRPAGFVEAAGQDIEGVSAEGDGVWQLLMFQSCLAASR